MFVTPAHWRRWALALAVAAAPLLAGADTWRILQHVDGSLTSLAADGRSAAGLAMDNFEAIRWTPREGVQRLGRGTWEALGQRSGTPRISEDGSVVSATILSDDGSHATAGRWTAAGGWKTLAPPLPAGGGIVDNEDCSAFGQSGDGQIVTGLFWLSGSFSARAMAWSAAAGMVDLGSSGRSSRADAGSRDGRVLVGWDEHPSFGNRRAAVWVDGVLTVLDDSDWPSEASAVNADGTVIVGYSGNPADFQTYATMWSWNGGGWTKTLLGVFTKRGATGFAYASGVSADGRIVVGGARPDGMSPRSVGFVWTAEGGFVDASDYLKAGGARLNPLQPVIGIGAISADGSTLAVVTQALVAPWTTRTLIARRGANGAP